MPSFSLLDRIFHGTAVPTAPLGGKLALQGLTVLAVDDSRFASDALRLMCHRSGARLRRAESLAAAQSHLRVYRPDVVLIDQGLPDGGGDGLIRELARQRPQGPVIIGISGDPDFAETMLAAGAHGFVAKPFPGLQAFQQAILCHLPDRSLRRSAEAVDDELAPDPLALRDDLEHAADLICRGAEGDLRHYLSGFVAGIARSSRDADLDRAATSARAETGDLEALRRLLDARIATARGAFNRPAG